jgi:hypothetical protein
VSVTAAEVILPCTVAAATPCQLGELSVMACRARCSARQFPCDGGSLTSTTVVTATYVTPCHQCTWCFIITIITPSLISTWCLSTLRILHTVDRLRQVHNTAHREQCCKDTCTLHPNATSCAILQNNLVSVQCATANSTADQMMHILYTGTNFTPPKQL